MNTIYQDDQFHLARKANHLRLRAGLISGMRRFFLEHDFLEVETPVRIPSPAPEEHIEAIPSACWFLQTSPELCMKRMLAAGYHRIFQICKCFRADERGLRHLPEFTMLEWYVAQFDYQQLMDQCEALVCAAFQKAGHEKSLTWQDKTISLAPPWERITVTEAFARYAPVTMSDAVRRQTFDEILAQYIEPNLGRVKPTFLYDYPAPLAALAQIKKNDPSVAERFELYIGGLELTNGFTELTDVDEQRQRFREALDKRAAKNWSRYTMPDKFLTTLENMPPAAGIALGIDRLTMLAANASSIDDVVAFPPEWL